VSIAVFEFADGLPDIATTRIAALFLIYRQDNRLQLHESFQGITLFAARMWAFVIAKRLT
jgi:hypothetical protein